MRRVISPRGAIFLLILGCSPGSTLQGGVSGSGGSAGSSGTGGAAGGAGRPTGSGGSGTGGTAGSGACVGLRCQQMACSGGQRTRVSGTVFSPKGDLALPNVAVYVPNAPLGAISDGASCDRCETTLSGDPIVQATTDTNGRFVLDNVPVGPGIPLVMQVGRWRRQVTLPAVTACTDNPVTDVALTRLPRNQAEGNIPRIGLTTGGADALECLIRKIGVDDAEITPPGGTGRVHLFVGEGGTDKMAPTVQGGAAFANATSLWDTTDGLRRYDVVVLSCEGTENPTNKSAAARMAMKQYLDLGGRVFASHWHNYWVEHGPAPLPTVATFNHQGDPANPFTVSIDTSFPKGRTLSEWLLANGASTTAGQLVVHEGQHTIDAVNPAIATRWIYSTMPASVQYLSFNAPVGVPADQQCGRLVLTDIHVSSGDESKPATPFPTGCTTMGLTPQEKALIFMLFDLSACLQPDIG